MMSSKKISKKEQGNTFIVVLMVLTVVSILVGAVGSMVNANIKMVKHQESSIRAFYVAQSGLEIGVAAMLQPQTPPAKTLVQELFASSIDDAHIRYTSASPLTDTMAVGSDTVDLRVYAQRLDGERWVVVNASGTLQGSGVSRQTTLRFLAENPSVIIRSSGN